MREGVAAVVLAAGAATRAAPHDKLLFLLAGVPVLVHTVSAVLAVPALRPVVVVTGGPGGQARAGVLAGLPVTLATVPDPGRGLSASLRAGLARVPPAAAGVLVVLGDMPYVQSLTLQRLLEAFAASEGQDICFPVMENRRGNPVLWPAAFREALMALEGDQGGRALLAAGPCRAVPVTDAGILRDLDSVADLMATQAAGP